MDVQPHQKVRFMTPVDVAGKGPGNCLLVDVREPFEVEDCAYSGGMDIFYLPYGLLKQRWQELPRDRPLIFACLSGKRSLRAAIYLAFKGYPDVANLEGGMRAWKAAGMPVHSEASDLKPLN